MKKTFHILFYFFALTLISCGDMNKNIEETVEAGSEFVQAEMTTDIINSKAKFEETYNKALQSSTDSLVTKKLRSFI